MRNTFCLALLLFTSQIFAQTHTEDFKIDSKYIKETRTITVSLPQQYENSSKAYPVILVLDKNLLFNTTSAIVNQLSNTSRMPESIVVSLSAGSKHRNYFAPNLHNNHRDRAYNYGNFQEEFLDFLEHELLPSINNKYRTNNFNTIVGFSPSSAIALYALLNRPDLFQVYICFAAGNIIGDGYNKDERLIENLDSLYANNDLGRNYLYVVSGSKDAEGQPYINTNTQDFNEKLSRHNSSSVHTRGEIIAGEGHTDVILPGLIAALDFMYPKEKWLVDYLDLIEKDGPALANILSFYKELSSEYGFEIYPNADRLYSMSCLKNVGRRLLGTNKVDEAIELYKYWVGLYPKSDLAHYYLGIAQAENENVSLAKASFAKAMELAPSQDSDDFLKYQNALEALDSAN
ncbi:hypothetical protein E1176_07680 [Fulvivirga sp. RKSG066]|uniref:alpha/beta hydrolase-fold protein n=1 Tax=Fulvivirga aurantia TaxID=2529383 RepID=UPI0012BC6606|nr:alpha/beta hydrolase-fold protein [Fulvivirga aurantia]MTI20897.1 hypothetical protein [Fulvivirga aurantia]